MQQKSEQNLTFFSRLEKLKLVKDVTWEKMAELLGISRTMIHFIKTGKYKVTPKNLYRLEELEKECGILEPKSSAPPSKGPELWNGPYYGSSDGAPIVSWASAGSSHAWEDQGEDVPRVKTNCKDHNCYALALVGDSMTPIYQPGDIIVCSPNLEAQPMDLIMLKTKSDDIYFKRYLGEKRGVHRFESYNPNYPIMEFEPKEIDKIHVVHSVVRIFKGRFF